VPVSNPFLSHTHTFSLFLQNLRCKSAANVMTGNSLDPLTTKRMMTSDSPGPVRDMHNEKLGSLRMHLLSVYDPSLSLSLSARYFAFLLSLSLSPSVSACPRAWPTLGQSNIADYVSCELSTLIAATSDISSARDQTPL